MTDFRFGRFELDSRTRELRKDGVRLRLQDQPFSVLALMLEHPGELLTRDELRDRLWPDGTFVDFEHGLNAAVKRLRSVLGDNAERPRFVETLHRRGYRFIARVERVNGGGAAHVLADATDARQRLAVLPFSHLGEASAPGSFASGLTEELITQLGRLCAGRLGVIARSSASGSCAAIARSAKSAMPCARNTSSRARCEPRAIAYASPRSSSTRTARHSSGPNPTSGPLPTACSPSPMWRRRSSAPSPSNCCPTGRPRRPPERGTSRRTRTTSRAAITGTGRAMKASANAWLSTTSRSSSIPVSYRHTVRWPARPGGRGLLPSRAPGGARRGRSLGGARAGHRSERVRSARRPRRSPPVPRLELGWSGRGIPPCAVVQSQQRSRSPALRRAARCPPPAPRGRGDDRSRTRARSAVPDRRDERRLGRIHRRPVRRCDRAVPPYDRHGRAYLAPHRFLAAALLQMGDVNASVHYLDSLPAVTTDQTSLAWLAHALGVKGDHDRARNILCQLDELAGERIVSSYHRALGQPASATSTPRLDALARLRGTRPVAHASRQRAAVRTDSVGRSLCGRDRAAWTECGDCRPCVTGTRRPWRSSRTKTWTSSTGPNSAGSASPLRFATHTARLSPHRPRHRTRHHERNADARLPAAGRTRPRSRLKVSRTTVVNAYRDLETRGLVRGYVGRGTFVSAAPEASGAPFAWRGKVAAAAARSSDSAIRDLLRHAADPSIVSVAAGIPALERFPPKRIAGRWIAS